MSLPERIRLEHGQPVPKLTLGLASPRRLSYDLSWKSPRSQSNLASLFYERAQAAFEEEIKSLRSLVAPNRYVRLLCEPVFKEVSKEHGKLCFKEREIQVLLFKQQSLISILQRRVGALFYLVENYFPRVNGLVTLRSLNQIPTNEMLLDRLMDVAVEIIGKECEPPEIILYKYIFTRGKKVNMGMVDLCNRILLFQRPVRKNLLKLIHSKGLNQIRSGFHAFMISLLKGESLEPNWTIHPTQVKDNYDFWLDRTVKKPTCDVINEIPKEYIGQFSCLYLQWLKLNFMLTNKQESEIQSLSILQTLSNAEFIKRFFEVIMLHLKDEQVGRVEYPYVFLNRVAQKALIEFNLKFKGDAADQEKMINSRPYFHRKEIVLKILLSELLLEFELSKSDLEEYFELKNLIFEKQTITDFLIPFIPWIRKLLERRSRDDLTYTFDRLLFESFPSSTHAKLIKISLPVIRNGRDFYAFYNPRIDELSLGVVSKEHLCPFDYGELVIG